MNESISSVLEEEPSEEDMKTFLQTLEMLRNKKAELEKQKISIAQEQNNANLSIHQEEELNQNLKKEFDEIKMKIESMPTQEDEALGIQLSQHLKGLETKLNDLKELIKEKKEEKKLKYDELYHPQAHKIYKKSINYIYQSLLDELSELVSQNAEPLILQAKEKQIRLCESLLCYC